MLGHTLFSLLLGILISRPHVESASYPSEADVCPSKPTLNDTCTMVHDWTSLEGAFMSAPLNGTLTFCPFDITKGKPTSLEISTEVNVQCKNINKGDACIIRGPGTHVIINSTQATNWQGLTFQGSDEHAVHIQTNTANTIHSFCNCNFIENKRMDTVRGGALKTERDSGIINIIACTFRENFSSYGGAIYDRSNIMNIIGSFFLDNASSDTGGAIYVAHHAVIAIADSFFIGNLDANSHAIVVQADTGFWIDENDNISTNNGNCDGFFNGITESCTPFSLSGPSQAPNMYTVPTQTFEPQMSYFERPVMHHTIMPSQVQSNSLVPSSNPSHTPSVSFKPSSNPSKSLQPSISAPPSSIPTITSAPTTLSIEICGQVDLNDNLPCITVKTWDEFIQILSTHNGELLFCPFLLTKTVLEPAIIDKDLRLICLRRLPQESCTINGMGNHFLVNADTDVTIHGFSFKHSDATAVKINTNSNAAETNICYCAFMNNIQNSTNATGAAISTGHESGVVNVVSTLFWGNKASVGAGIYSKSNQMNVVSCLFTVNFADKTASAIYVNAKSHLFLRGNTFNSNLAKQDNYSVVVQPMNISDPFITRGHYVDGGDNLSFDEDLCPGVYDEVLNECYAFAVKPAFASVIYPFIPGDLTTYDENTGLLLATGLRVKVLAQTDKNVHFTSKRSSQEHSVHPFHDAPDGAAVVEATNGGWTYVSNSESLKGNGKGGVWAIHFDPTGAVEDYTPLLQGTTRNCNGGLTPWKTWISCEEFAHGQCWQVDPTGEKEAERTVLSETEGGNFEAFAYDDRNASFPAFFITEDHERGALRRFRPEISQTVTSYVNITSFVNGTSKLNGTNSTTNDGFIETIETIVVTETHTLNTTWDMLHGPGIRDYLYFLPNNTFIWVSSLELGRLNAAKYFPKTEGISRRGSILYFVAKEIQALFICNLDTMSWTVEYTSKGLVIGNGSFRQQPDHLVQLTDEILYFTEDGGRTPGVYGRVTSTGHYFAILEAHAEHFKGDEATGLAFSPDWTRLYVALQENGILYEVTRKDGKPFQEIKVK